MLARPPSKTPAWTRVKGGTQRRHSMPAELWAVESNVPARVPCSFVLSLLPGHLPTCQTVSRAAMSNSTNSWRAPETGLARWRE